MIKTVSGNCRCYLERAYASRLETMISRSMKGSHGEPERKRERERERENKGGWKRIKCQSDRDRGRQRGRHTQMEEKWRIN